MPGTVKKFFHCSNYVKHDHWRFCVYEFIWILMNLNHRSPHVNIPVILGPVFRIFKAICPECQGRAKITSQFRHRSPAFRSCKATLMHVKPGLFYSKPGFVVYLGRWMSVISGSHWLVAKDNDPPCTCCESVHDCFGNCTASETFSPAVLCVLRAGNRCTMPISSLNNIKDLFTLSFFDRIEESVVND